MAKVDEGLTNAPSSVEEEEAQLAQARANKIFKDFRTTPIHKANLSLYLRREKVRITAQIKEKEKKRAKERRTGVGAGGGRGKKKGKGNADKDKDSDSQNGTGYELNEIEKKKKLLKECLSFEHNINMLEVYLVYNMYMSAAQALAVVQVFIDRKARMRCSLE